MRNSRAKTSPSAADAAALQWAGEPLWSTIRLMVLPALFAMSLLSFGLKPGGLVLYGFAALFITLVLLRLRHGPEALLATAVLYLPLHKEYVASLAPGINGPNGLEILILLVWIGSAIRNRRPMFVSRPFTRVVTVWALFSLLSILVGIVHEGISEFYWNHSETLRTWVDQFVIFFAFTNLIQDKHTARRILVYMMISAVVVFLFGFHEWFGKRLAATIEKSRLLGPVQQPNEFGALVVYSIAPFLACAAYYFPRPKSWLLLPVFAVFLRVLLGIFSRGAYLAFGFEVLAASFVRSRKLFVLVALGLISIYWYAPDLIPHSLQARVAQTYEDRTMGGKYDKSAEQRLVMWEAAQDMIERHPLVGEGFDSFHLRYRQYVSRSVNVSDTHNMYFYVATQMGLPALICLLSIVLLTLKRGWRMFRKATLDIDRIIGLGAAIMSIGLLVVNMFGSHMVDTAVDGFFWVYLAMMGILLADLPSTADATKDKPGGLPA